MSFNLIYFYKNLKIVKTSKSFREKIVKNPGKILKKKIF